MKKKKKTVIIKKCVHCGLLFISKDTVENHQSNYCCKCRERHRGVEIIE